jgi:ketopantoate reductase
MRIVVMGSGGTGGYFGAKLARTGQDVTLVARGAHLEGAASSLQHDLLNGKRLELEALHGHAVRLGERYGVPTPTGFAVYAALLPHLDGRK